MSKTPCPKPFVLNLGGMGLQGRFLTPLFNKFRGDSIAILWSALRFQISRFYCTNEIVAIIQKKKKKLEKAGTVDSKKHPARKVGTRSRQCQPKVPGRFAFAGARNPRICSSSRSEKHFLALHFPVVFLGNPRTATAFFPCLI